MMKSLWWIPICVGSLVCCAQHPTAHDGGVCSPCVSDYDCSSAEVCAQTGSGALCLTPCTATAGCYMTGELCAPVIGSDGGQQMACLTAACAPAGVSATDAGNSGAGNPIPKVPVGGTLTADAGGSESLLYFAVIGDTRPPNEDDTSAYPTTIIETIYQHIQHLNPAPPFVISTGDYQYASTTGGQQQTQLGYYQKARNAYSGIDWPAMGNHECDGFTDSTCGFPGSQYPAPTITPNFTVWAGMFLTPIGETTPNYIRNVKAPDGSWSAKFIFCAPNYWDPSTQNSWLSNALGVSTTYTFVVHHEDKSSSSPPASLATIESMESGKETLSIVGHNHIWRYTASTPEVIVGNGGAPLDEHGQVYGFTLFTQQPNGSILVTPFESCSSSGSCMGSPQPLTSQQFTVH